MKDKNTFSFQILNKCATILYLCYVNMTPNICILQYRIIGPLSIILTIRFRLVIYFQVFQFFINYLVVVKKIFLPHLEDKTFKFI